ncbi:hypothetical protein Tco_0314388 [Tanacetum coccineum]
MTDSTTTAKQPKRPVRHKRTWTPQEDEKLMEAMMELQASGRLKTLKGNFGVMHDMVLGSSTNGFGWDPDKCVIAAPNDVWDAYVKIF